MTPTGRAPATTTVLTISLTVEGTRGTGLLAAESDGTVREIKRT